jgi:hypothetical protein
MLLKKKNLNRTHNFWKPRFLLYAIGLIIGFSMPKYGLAQNRLKTLTPEMLSMSRSKMYLEDNQVVLFNGIGSANPRQFSITGLTNLKFYPIDIPDYNFHLNFFDNKSSTLIQDDAPLLWKEWVEKGTGTDPLGSNFRPGFAKLIVTQDEEWQPNQYYRKGIFHKKADSNWISFGIESWTSVSGSADEILIKIKLVNYASEGLDISLIPIQKASRLALPGKTGSTEVKQIDPFTISSEQMRVSVSSNICQTNEKGFRITLPAEKTGEFYFLIKPSQELNIQSSSCQSEIKEKFAKAYQRTCERLQFTADRLPLIRTEDKQINELYKRCLLTVNECKWERNNFIVNPFWASGTWPISMIWDQCFSEEVLAMIDPKGLKESIMLELRECKMKQSYIFWHGAVGDIIYIQNPFALQTTIDAYITYTGDKSILNEKTGDATVYEWMKRWVYELHDNYSRPDGLIDVGFSTEKIIEIRTDGYNHVVPVISGLTADFYRRMSEWAFDLGDKDASKFKNWSEQIQKSFTKELWNEELGWFDNLYPDGKKGTTWTYHLYDLLESNILNNYQKHRIIEHIRDGEFLAPYGLYSISKRDTIHWDRIDADFGGGGQYVGMTLRIALNLFKNGYPLEGFEILKRFSKYTDHFPYLTHNPWSDKMFQDQSSMALQISAGAGIEAIISGIFGVRPNVNGDIEFNPSHNLELGNSELTDFQFRGNTYEVILKSDYFLVKKNGVLIANNKYGNKLLIQTD